MRLQKFLSRAEVASRRRAEVLIEAGRVSVNGVVVTELGTKVEPGTDRVEVDGREVRIGTPVWVALYKPRGYVTTRDDPRGRRTVYDLLPPEHRGLFHVGRLDYDSEGLLLLTNQGDAANWLLHPRHGVARVYDANVRGTPDAAALERLRRGVTLEDGTARAERVELIRSSRRGNVRVRVLLREGRNREVRRMFAAVGHPVTRLIRRRYGPIRLGSLSAGEWRALSERESAALERRVGGRRRGTGRDARTDARD